MYNDTIQQNEQTMNPGTTEPVAQLLPLNSCAHPMVPCGITFIIIDLMRILETESHLQIKMHEKATWNSRFSSLGVVTVHRREILLGMKILYF